MSSSSSLSPFPATAASTSSSPTPSTSSFSSSSSPTPTTTATSSSTTTAPVKKLPSYLPKCDTCQKKTASLHCSDCDKNYCETPCSTTFHAPSSASSHHTLTDIDENSISPPIELTSFSSTIGFRCQPSHMYECFTSATMISNYTQSPCKTDAKEGGNFSFFDGSVYGKYFQLSKSKDNKNITIVLRWRMKEWKECDMSVVTIELSAPDSTTCKMVFKQSGIPEHDKYGNRGVSDKVKKGWEMFFWERIQKMVGYVKVEL